MDDEMGVLLLNFIADYWDIIEQYRLINDTAKTEKRSASRPTCSVLIKHMKERGDIFFAHNTWHEYRAMAFRYNIISTLYININILTCVRTYLLMQVFEELQLELSHFAWVFYPHSRSHYCHVKLRR